MVAQGDRPVGFRQNRRETRCPGVQAPNWLSAWLPAGCFAFEKVPCRDVFNSCSDRAMRAAACAVLTGKSLTFALRQPFSRIILEMRQPRFVSSVVLRGAHQHSVRHQFICQAAQARFGCCDIAHRCRRRCTAGWGKPDRTRLPKTESHSPFSAALCFSRGR